MPLRDRGNNGIPPGFQKDMAGSACNMWGPPNALPPPTHDTGTWCPHPGAVHPIKLGSERAWRPWKSADCDGHPVGRQHQGTHGWHAFRPGSIAMTELGMLFQADAMRAWSSSTPRGGRGGSHGQLWAWRAGTGPSESPPRGGVGNGRSKCVRCPSMPDRAGGAEDSNYFVAICDTHPSLVRPEVGRPRCPDRVSPAPQALGPGVLAGRSAFGEFQPTFPLRAVFEVADIVSSCS